MPPVYAERLSRVRKAVDAAFGDRVHAVPLVKGPRHGFGQSVPDPARAPFDFVGKLAITRRGEVNLAAAQTNQWEARLGTFRAELHVDVDVWPVAKTLKAGDRVEFPDRAMAFEISRDDEGGITRLVFNLSRLPT